MPVTLRDIARRANVSPSLVSGVLNERDGVYVSDAKRELIQATARAMGYRPNAAARALRRGRTQTIAFLFVGRAGLPGGGYFLDYPTGVIEALADVLGRQGYDVLVKVHNPDDEGAPSARDLVHPSLCDAAVLWGEELAVRRTGEELEGAGVPFVAKGYHEKAHPDWPQVEFDHRGMMHAAVRQLVAEGRQTVAYLGLRERAEFVLRLEEGFREALWTVAGRRPRAELLSDRGDLPETAVAQVGEWMSLPESQRPDAIALGGLDAAWDGVDLGLAQVGLRMGAGPTCISVAGHGNSATRSLFGTGHAFDSVQQAELARAMVRELLVPLLERRPIARPIVHVLPALREKASWRLTLPASGQSGLPVARAGGSEQ